MKKTILLFFIVMSIIFTACSEVSYNPIVVYNGAIYEEADLYWECINNIESQKTNVYIGDVRQDNIYEPNGLWVYFYENDPERICMKNDNYLYIRKDFKLPDYLNDIDMIDKIEFIFQDKKAVITDIDLITSFTRTASEAAVSDKLNNDYVFDFKHKGDIYVYFKNTILRYHIGWINVSNNRVYMQNFMNQSYLLDENSSFCFEEDLNIFLIGRLK